MKRSRAPLIGFSIPLALGVVLLLPSPARALTVALDRFGTTGDDSAQRVSVSRAGVVWVAGSAATTLPGQLVGEGGAGRFLRKYEHFPQSALTIQGSELRSVPISTPAQWQVSGVGRGPIAAMPDGSVYESGWAVLSTPDYVAPQLGWLRRYSADGPRLWAVNADGQTMVAAVRADGTLFTGGFHAGYHNCHMTCAAIDGAGAILWSESAAPDDDYSMQIGSAAAGPGGDSFVSGAYQAQWGVLPGCIDPGPPSSPVHSFFLRQYSADGTSAWTRQFFDGSAPWGMAAADDYVVVGRAAVVECFAAKDGALRWRRDVADVWPVAAGSVAGLVAGPDGYPLLVAVPPDSSGEAGARSLQVATVDPETGHLIEVSELADVPGGASIAEIASSGETLAVAGSVTGPFGEQELGGSDAFVLVASGIPRPPCVRLDVQPPLPDGSNGWYVRRPAARLTAGVPIWTALDAAGLEPYEPGTQLMIPEGEHVLRYVGGSTANPTKSRSLKLDLTPPAVGLGGVRDSGRYALPLSLVIEASDGQSGIASTQGTIDGAPFASGDLVKRPGEHVVTLKATDAAGWSKSRTMRFLVLPSAALSARLTLASRARLPVTISGKLTPAPSAAKPVKIFFYQAYARRWRRGPIRTATVHALSGAYRIKVRLGRGYWKVIAECRDQESSRAVSAPCRFRVR
jgi:hypothetical protein